jgi:Tfp pilus assembly protein PilV
MPAQPFRRGNIAFTLLEVMIACGIFFMASFAILALVAGTLRNARALQRGDVDAGMAAAQLYTMLRTNRDEFGSASGDFGETYPDCSWEAEWEPYQTNGLLTVDIVVNRRGNRQPIDKMTIWVFSPNTRVPPGGSRLRP